MRRSLGHIHLLAAWVVGVAGVILLLLTPRAQAFEIPGATYNGNVTGDGAMSFTVSPDGTGITSFNVAGPLTGNFCTFSGIGATYTVPLPIANHSFTDTSPPLTFTGSFTGAQSAQGTLRMRSTSPPYCDTGDLAWTATTTASPPVLPPAVVPPSTPVGDTTPPTLALGGATAQRVLSQRGVVVVVTCPTEACIVTAKGTVSVPGAAKTFKFTSLTRQVSRGGRATLKLKLGKSALTAVKRALKAGRKLTAKVTLTAKDTAGNITTKRRSIRLR